MKKLHSRTALFFGIVSLAMSGSAIAGSDIDNMTKEDLYKMILDLKQEVQQLQQTQPPSINTTSKEDIQTIVQDELASNAAESESLADKVAIHASLSQGYLYSNHNNWLGDTDGGTFDYNEFTINFSANLTDKLRAGIQLMSRDVGDFANNDLQIDWANMDYAWKDQLGFRAGILKVPFGFYNESRDIDAARIAVMLPQGFYSENIRELTNDLTGASAYGSVDLNTFGSLSYNLLYGGSDLDSDGETAAVYADTGSFDVGAVSDLNLSNVFVGALLWQAPVEGLLFNFNYIHAEVEVKGLKTIPSVGTLDATLETNAFENISIGMEYSWNDLIVAAEYRRASTEYDYTVNNTTQQLPESNPSGWYVSGSYRFNTWLASEVSYSEYWYDDNDKDGTRNGLGIYAYQNTLSVNARFDINDYWIIKAGVNFNEGLGTAYQFQNEDNPEKDWMLFQLKSTVSF